MHITEINAWVARVKAKRVEGEPYPSDLRDIVATYASKKRQSGRTWAAIEAEVGLSSTTLRNWMQARDTRGFHQLQIVDDCVGDHVGDLVEDHVETIDTAPVMLTSPRGFTVTGCTIEDIARLLAAVG